MSASPWADRCPECVGPINEPKVMVEDGKSANCVYECSACRHRWSCSWALARSAMPDLGEAESEAS